jgi:asparagine synthetase B (glutamine-hydrolysing)
MILFLLEQVFHVLCQKAITESGIKVVLSGEGADEVLEVICILKCPFSRGFQKKHREYKMFTADLLACQNQLWRKV